MCCWGSCCEESRWPRALCRDPLRWSRNRTLGWLLRVKDSAWWESRSRASPSHVWGPCQAVLALGLLVGLAETFSELQCSPMLFLTSAPSLLSCLVWPAGSMSSPHFCSLLPFCVTDLNSILASASWRTWSGTSYLWKMFLLLSVSEQSWTHLLLPLPLCEKADPGKLCYNSWESASKREKCFDSFSSFRMDINFGCGESFLTGALHACIFHLLPGVSTVPCLITTRNHS